MNCSHNYINVHIVHIYNIIWIINNLRFLSLNIIKMHRHKFWFNKHLKLKF